VSSERPDGDGLLGRTRAICLRLPDVTERLSHGTPTWFIRDRRAFATLWHHGHHDLTFPHLWCAAPAGAQEDLVAGEPDRFFRPPYVGHRGWIGVRLDAPIDDDVLEGLLQQAHEAVRGGRR
jgi:hypothetical protein